MSANGHALVRTSPLRTPFIGTCMKCGMTDLPITACGKPCANPANLTPDEALLIAMGKRQ